jgi:hypothetical protein
MYIMWVFIYTFFLFEKSFTVSPAKDDLLIVAIVLPAERLKRLCLEPRLKNDHL